MATVQIKDLNPEIPPTLHKILTKIYKNSTGGPANPGQGNPVTIVPATRSSPSMICQKVTGQNGHSGLLCKAMPTNSTESVMQRRMEAQMALKVGTDSAFSILMPDCLASHGVDCRVCACIIQLPPADIAALFTGCRRCLFKSPPWR